MLSLAHIIYDTVEVSKRLWRKQTSGLSSVEGQVLSSGDGMPVRRAVVTLQRSTGCAVRPGEPPQQPPMSPSEVETDDQGHFAFRDLEAGGYLDV
jgi:hypothetical protein